MNEASEVNAEEGEFRVGDRIDEVADEELAIGSDLVVLAAKGNDFGGRFSTRSADDTIGMEASAADDEFCLKIAGGSMGVPRAILGVE